MSDRPNLAEAFRPAARPTPSPAPHTVPSAPEPTSDPRPDIRLGDDPGSVHNVAVYLPVDLRNQVRERARQRGITITELVEEAFAQHGANYHELQAQPPARPGTMPTRSGRRRGSGTIQIQLRLDDRQHTWLDTQVDRHGAPSRSALVTAVLARHLGTQW